MRRVALFVAFAATVALAGPAGAQEKKKQRTSSEETTKNAKGFGGGQPCSGLMWIGASCYMPDGRICEVREGTSGGANLSCSAPPR